MSLRASRATTLALTLCAGCSTQPPATDETSSTSTSETGGETGGEPYECPEPEDPPTCDEPIVHEGLLTLSSAEDVAAYACLSEVGQLEISGSGITDLHFPLLERIGGQLRIHDCPDLQLISGFPLLTEVSSVWIQKSPALECITGFGSVTSLIGDLHFSNLQQLRRATGFANVQTIGGWIEARWLDSMTNFTGAFDSLTSVGGIELEQSGFVSLAGLESLTQIDEPLQLRENPALSSLAGLSSLTDVGEVMIVDNDALTSLSGLDSIAQVRGSLRIEGNDALMDLAGLELLDSIFFDLLVIENASLAAVTGEQVPASIGGRVIVCSNESLADLPGDVSATAGGVMVTHNHALDPDKGQDFAAALGHPDAKVGSNADFAMYPVSPCPWTNDGVCDEVESTSGDVGYFCDVSTGRGCCERQGPTGLCTVGSEPANECSG